MIFIIQTTRKTHLKYLVEVETEDQVLDEDGRYIGYLDGEIEEESIIGGPFETTDAAMADISSYTEGQ